MITSVKEKLKRSLDQKSMTIKIHDKIHNIAQLNACI